MKKIFLLLYLLISITTISQSNWEQIILPDSIVLKDIAFDSSGNHFLATSHGVYFSQNGEQWEWQGVNDYLGVITINDINTIYTASGTLYRSFDNGLTWDSLFYHSQGGLTSVFSIDDETIILGTWGGIIKSADSGQTWYQVLDVLNSEVVNDIGSNSQGILFAGSISYIGGDYPGGIYRSDDNGESWNLVGLEYNFVSSVEINSYDTVFVGTRGHWYSGGGGVFMSSNNGNSWQVKYDNNLVTSMCINDYNTIFIGCSTLDGALGGVYQSFDNGEIWEDISFDLPNRHIEDIETNSIYYLYVISYNDHDLYKTVNPITETNNLLIEFLKDIEITPNPVKNSLFLKCTKSDKIFMDKIYIMDITGRVVKQFHSVNINKLLILDISNLSPAIYFVHLVYNNKKAYFKFIKY
jgi:photosystem II stability/assembly factor-like uncharacterized protein